MLNFFSAEGTVKARELPILERVERLSDYTLQDLSLIENSSQRDPLPRKQLMKLISRNRGSITAARMHGRIVAHCIWKLHPGHLSIHRIGVLPAFRRQGIGRTLLQDVCHRQMGNYHKTAYAIFEHLPFHDGAAFLFRRCGFTARLADGEFLVFERKLA